MLFKHHIPKAPYSDFLNSIIYFKGYHPEHKVERVVPDGFVHLIFELDGIDRNIYDNVTGASLMTVSGGWMAPILSKYLTISAHNNSEMIVAQIHPYGAFPLFDQSLNKFPGEIIPAPRVKEINISKFRNSMIDLMSPESKISFLEDQLMGFIQEQKIPKPFVIDAINAMRSNANEKLVNLVQSSGYSKKQFIKLFKKYIGITPKKYQRILRFNEILKKIKEGNFISWVDISLDCGYFDQAHFIKDFKAFSGLNPTDFLDIHKTTERINFFPLD
jgi:AraC-like DNA-binding protein